MQDVSPFVEITTQQQHFTPEQHYSPVVMSMPQCPFPHPEGMIDVQQQPDCQDQEAPVVGKSKEWMKYTTKALQQGTEDGNGIGKKKKKSAVDQGKSQPWMSKLNPASSNKCHSRINLATLAFTLAWWMTRVGPMARES
jgi:hypothetical protein